MCRRTAAGRARRRRPAPRPPDTPAAQRRTAHDEATWLWGYLTAALPARMLPRAVTAIANIRGALARSAPPRRRRCTCRR